ncbi:flagellar hook assembly protein FlgD [Polaromonas sp. OV174]|uniref:flagellar hook assembly protein FlgD n=1 Tax=Polaromonas sp. OV174 TaxID=1855300 RepID=UPI002101129A|nr:flagellar hook assembly protein FlgD [Polaromonas sp. OV174]
MNATKDTSGLGALNPGGTTGAESEQRFLKLLVSQLNNQDPLNPLDNAELTSQLAQMSTVSGIEKLNAAFQSLLDQSGTNQVLQSAALVGRQVLVPGSDLKLEAGKEMPFAIETQGAESVKVTITNAAGETVRTFDLGSLSTGLKTLSWDGLADDGSVAAEGGYTISVKSMSGDVAVQSRALTYAAVTSVAQGPRGVELDLGAGRIATLDDVRLIL